MFALPLAVGCAADAPGGGAVVRDSAGIAIIENPSPDTTTVFASLGETPSVVIGEAMGAPEQQLYRVSGGARLSDGRIVIANAGTELRFYDGEGRYQQTVGRRGEGPGEFTGLSQIMVGEEDSLYAYDRGSRRLSILSAEGELVRSHRLEPQQERALSLADRFSDGTFLALTGFSSSDRRDFRQEEVARPRARALRFVPDLSSADTLLEYAGPEMHFRPDRWGGLLLGRVAHVTAHDTLLYVATQEHGFEVVVYGTGGAQQRRIRAATTPAPSAPVVRFLLDSARKALPPEQHTAIEQRYAETPIPELLPPHGRLLVDAEANLWVAEYTPLQQRPRLWTVFDPTGRFAGVVRLPMEGLELFEVGGSHVLARHSDALDVERVMLFELQRKR
ncbi:MAG TPA: 6-bladed beta-propeller [Longimicrobiales bacterium]|nr:6-bladed beta-propeller [Longimicrobiales bacterium]